MEMANQPTPPPPLNVRPSPEIRGPLIRTYEKPIGFPYEGPFLTPDFWVMTGWDGDGMVIKEHLGIWWW